VPGNDHGPNGAFARTPEGPRPDVQRVGSRDAPARAPDRLERGEPSGGCRHRLKYGVPAGTHPDRANAGGKMGVRFIDHDQPGRPHLAPALQLAARQHALIMEPIIMLQA